jgi:hypothetical protein
MVSKRRRNRRATPTGEALQAIVDFDLAELADLLYTMRDHLS